jgi:hypothetical protein
MKWLKPARQFSIKIEAEDVCFHIEGANAEETYNLWQRVRRAIAHDDYGKPQG